MTKIYKILKRDGEKTLFNVAKIKKVIEWASVGLDVNRIELESKATIKMRDGMTTEEIQRNLINTALSMTNIDDFTNLQWKNVAARLSLLNLYKEAKRLRGHDAFGYGPYYSFVKKAVALGIYDPQITDEYTKNELQEMGKFRDMRHDYDYDYSAMNLLMSRYLMKYEGKTFELPQDMYLTLALLLAVPEKKENRLEVAKKFYKAFASRKISPATPIVLNLRRPNGNLASCFITAMDDSLDSIYYTLDQLAQISKNAGGVGLNISRVRSHGSRIKGIKGASGGVMPWIKLVNDTAVAVNQLGSRSGAITVALDIWHKDMDQFLEMQTENGDHRKKAFDVFPQVVIPDEFMRRVEAKQSWTLVDPHEVRKKYNVELAELYGEEFETFYAKLEADDKLESKEVVDARTLLKTMLKTVVETGMPYVSFKDTMNKGNPNKHCGMIGNANLCTESFSNFSPSKIQPKKLTEDRSSITQEILTGETHTCNLVSLNLAEILDDETLTEMTKLSVRILDNTIDVAAPPLPEADKHNNEYRILGVGTLGLADHLVYNGLSYDNSGDFCDKLFEKVALAGIEASSELAEERGSYHYFKGSDWDKGHFFGRDAQWYDTESDNPVAWKELRAKVKKHGMRNGGLFAIAPNTSTSLLMGATASILPIFSKFFVDKASNGVVPVAPPFMNQKNFWKYKENKNIDQQEVIEVVSKIQKWTDQGISMEMILNIKDGIKAKDIYALYYTAWTKGCKTVYYVRSLIKSGEISDKEECVSCAN
jgi:ribonucleoside-diphosphate reductase alpha chain